MPIVAADIVAYGSASMPDDDTPVNIGGAIDLTIRVVFTDIVATDQIEALSDNAGDTTQNLDIFGRNAAGEIINESNLLTGTSVVLWTATYERVLKAVLDASTTGVITVRDQDTDTTIMLFASGELEIRRPFYDSAADESGGASRDYHDKIFFKNNHASLTLTNAVVKENADPSGNVAFSLESTLDGSDTNGGGNNRLVAPGGHTFDSTDKNVANSQNLTALAAQGCWLRLTLAAGAAANNTTVTMRVTGNTV